MSTTIDIRPDAAAAASASPNKYPVWVDGPAARFGKAYFYLLSDSLLLSLLYVTNEKLSVLHSVILYTYSRDGNVIKRENSIAELMLPTGPSVEQMKDLAVNAMRAKLAEQIESKAAALDLLGGKTTGNVLTGLMEENAGNLEDLSDKYAQGYHDALLDAMNRLGIETDEKHFD